MDNIAKDLLEKVADLKDTPAGAYNIRLNGGAAGRQSTENIKIEGKTDVQGIDIIIKEGTVDEKVFIPVVVTSNGHKELVYNDFFIGDNSDITIIAGCGMHTHGDGESEHSGIHRFFVGKNSKVKYVEKHYGFNAEAGISVMNPHTIVEIAEGGYMEMETVQIGGIDRSNRVTDAKVGEKGTLVIKEKILTEGKQYAESHFNVDMDGADSSTSVVSRVVAKNESKQVFYSKIQGNNKCYGHTECDGIIMDTAVVSAIPEITANHLEAGLVHEAAIGKIAGEQILKLMTLGLSEEEAEAQIINGFLK